MRLLEDRELFEEVVIGGILSAERSVLIATANLKNIAVPVSKTRRAASLVETLVELARRDVFIQILHASAPSARFRTDAKKHGLEKNPNIILFKCPRVHFKAVIVDGRWIYLGSANLTGAGFGAKSERTRNFEYGFVSEDKALIQRVTDKFNWIVEKEACGNCRYFNQCWPR